MSCQALKLLPVQEGARVLTPVAGVRDLALDAAAHAARAAWRSAAPETTDHAAALFIALNVHRAAELLHIKPTTLNEKIKRLRIRYRD
jgi:DNA-binding NtrC family response regulator